MGGWQGGCSFSDSPLAALGRGGVDFCRQGVRVLPIEGTAWRAMPVQRLKVETRSCWIAADPVGGRIFNPPTPTEMAGEGDRVREEPRTRLEDCRGGQFLHFGHRTRYESDRHNLPQTSARMWHTSHASAHFCPAFRVQAPGFWCVFCRKFGLSRVAALAPPW